MDWRAKVELFEQIRRDYEHGEETIRSLARKFGVHRRMVRQALVNALPPERKRPERTFGEVDAQDQPRILHRGIFDDVDE